jgi:hypothetical protein
VVDNPFQTSITASSSLTSQVYPTASISPCFDSSMFSNHLTRSTAARSAVEESRSRITIWLDPDSNVRAKRFQLEQLQDTDLSASWMQWSEWTGFILEQREKVRRMRRVNLLYGHGKASRGFYSDVDRLEHYLRSLWPTSSSSSSFHSCALG